MCAITITFIFLKYTKLALSLCIIGNKNTPLNLYYFLTTVNVFFKRIIVTSHILSPQWIPRGVTTCKHLSVNNQNRDQLKHLLCSRSLAKEHHEEGKPLHIAPEAHHRFHKQHRRGGSRGGSRIATRLSREVATMTANVRNITQQCMSCWRNAGQQGFPIPPYAAQQNAFHDPSQGNYYHGEEKVQRQMTGYQQHTREEAP